MMANPASGSAGSISGEFRFAIDRALGNIKKAERSLDKLNKKTTTVEKGGKKSSKTIDKNSASMGKAATASRLFTRELQSLSYAFGALTAIGAAGAMVKIASDIEQGFVGVKRTTGLAGDAFDRLRSQIMTLAGELRGIDLSGILDVARIGGQLGLASDTLAEFTETVIKSAYAMDLGAEEASNYLARIGQNMGEPIENFIRIANVANHLSNTTKATAGEILEISNRMAGTANVFGLATADMIALATATRDSGEQIEVAGSAWVQILNRMLTNTERFAHVAGVSLEEFRETIIKNPIHAIELLAQGFARLNKFGQAKALEDLQLQGVRVGPVLVKLANNMDSFGKILKEANQEWENGTSVEREYQAAAETLGASMSQLWNSIKLLSDTMSKELLPFLRDTTDLFSKAIRYMAGYGETAEATTKRIQEQIEKSEGLRASFDRLTESQNKSAKEQADLNDIADSLLEVMPDLTFEYDKHGNVIGLNTERYRELVAAMREAERVSKEAERSILNTQHAAAVANISQFESRIKWLKEFAAEEGIDAMASGGKTYRQWINQLERSLAEQKRERKRIYDQIAGVTAKQESEPEEPSKGIKEAKKAGGVAEYVPYEGGEEEGETGGAGTTQARDRKPLQIDEYDETEAQLARERKQVDLNRRMMALEVEANGTLKDTLTQRIEIQRQYYADLKALAEKENSLRLSRLEDSYREQLRAAEEYRSEYEISDEEHQQNLQKIAEEYNQEKIALQEDYHLELERLNVDWYEKEKQLRDQAHQQELRDIDQQNREKQRKLKELKNSFQRILDPLSDGGDWKEIFMNLAEELVSELGAAVMSRAEYGGELQFGGILGSILGGVARGVAISSGGGVPDGTLTADNVYAINPPEIGVTSLKIDKSAETPMISNSAWFRDEPDANAATPTMEPPIETVDAELPEMEPPIVTVDAELPEMEPPTVTVDAELPEMEPPTVEVNVPADFDRNGDVPSWLSSIQDEPTWLTKPIIVEKEIASEQKPFDFSGIKIDAPIVEVEQATTEPPRINIAAPRVDVAPLQPAASIIPSMPDYSSFIIPQIKGPTSSISGMNSEPRRESTSVYNSNLNMTINTNGGAFDQRAADSVKKYVDERVRKVIMDDMRRRGAIHQQQTRG